MYMLQARDFQVHSMLLQLCISRWKWVRTMVSPMGEKKRPKCTLENVEPLQRPGTSSTDAVNLCVGGRWTSLDTQPCWKTSVRLKSRRQFQRLILNSWAGIALLQVRLCNPVLQRRCVSQANGSKSGSILVMICRELSTRMSKLLSNTEDLGREFQCQRDHEEPLGDPFHREEPLGVLRNVLWATSCH